MLTPSEHQNLEKHIHGVDMARLTATFDALSEPNRCLIFRALLKGRSIRVGEVASIIGISDSLASQHLKTLLQVELVRKQKRGKYVYYHVNETNPLVGALQKAVES